MKNIPVFFSFNDNYVVPAAVSFSSLLRKCKDGVFYDMYVLHSGISTENQHFLKDTVEQTKKGRLTFVDVKDFLLDEWAANNWENNNKGSKFTRETVYRCFAAGFFPDLERIIYSDVDIVFMDDISELHDVELGDNYMLGVRNALMKHDSNELSHLKPEFYEALKDTYVAGGIWVLNLRKIREDKLEERMMEIIRDNTIIKRWNDQDVMNLACAGKVGFIPLHYISYPYLLDIITQPNFTSHYSREELYDSLLTPKILHYAGDKPWNCTHCKKSELWFEHFYYLGLNERFPHFVRKPQDRWKKKYHKYKKLLYITATYAIAATLGAAVLALLSLQ